MVDPCLSATITQSTSVGAQSYTLGTAAHSFTIPPYSSDVLDSICGSIVYSFTLAKTGGGSTTLISPNTATRVVTVVSGTAIDAGSYTISMHGQQGAYSARKLTVAVTLTVINSCNSNSIVAPTYESKTYYYRDAAITFMQGAWSNSNPASTVAICGAWTF